MDDDTIKRLAGKMLVAEMRLAESNHPRSRRDVAAIDAKAEGIAETIVTALDLPIAPWGLRDAARRFMQAAGPCPSPSSPGAHDDWFARVRGELVVTLKGG